MPNLTDWSKSTLGSPAGQGENHSEVADEQTRAASEAGDAHPEEKPQGDPRSSARSVFAERLPRLDHRPHRRTCRTLEAEPPLLLPLKGGDLRRRARGYPRAVAGPA